MKVQIQNVGNSRELSLLLYFMSLFGSGLVFVGICATLAMVTEGMFTGIPAGICIIAAGIVVRRFPYIRYYRIMQYINFNRMKKEIEEKGLEPYIASSVKNALKIYSTALGKTAFNYIKSLNPEAAEIIISHEKQKKQKK